MKISVCLLIKESVCRKLCAYVEMLFYKLKSIRMPQQQAVLSVSQLNVLAKDILESSFPSVLVEGEVSNLAKPGSGHVYFSLKDNKAQIRVALFAGVKNRLGFQLENGQKLLVKGNLSLFTNRGDFQLIARSAEPAGEGDLRRQFEALKQKLEQAGWFDPARKKALPRFCTHLAVITSPSGAAVRDILHVLERRYPLLEVTIIPSLVQGKSASEQLCQALIKANHLKASGDEGFQFDMVLLARGGGSLEDLWPFNEESLAQCIFDSELPVISGVGHETDYTICDWVADYRAPTPSAAAETLSEDQDALARQLADILEDLQQAISQKIASESKTLLHISKRNISPRQRLQEQYQRLDYLEQGLIQKINTRLTHLNHRIEQAHGRLLANKPDNKVQLMQTQYLSLKQRLFRQVQQSHISHHKHLHFLARRLDSLSPLRTLDRGYSISSIKDGDNLRTVSEQNPAKVGQTLITRLSHARIESSITQVTQVENLETE